MSDIFFLAADTVPVWSRAAAVFLIVVLIGLALYVATSDD